MPSSWAASFAEGEVWSYKTRAGETDSTLLINKIENDPRLGVIYHISVLGVLVKSRHAPSGVTRELPHIPVGRETLEASCIRMVGRSAPNPAYADGYAQWRQAFEEGQAGVFNIPVSEIVGVVESAINQ